MAVAGEEPQISEEDLSGLSSIQATTLKDAEVRSLVDNYFEESYSESEEVTSEDVVGEFFEVEGFIEDTAMEQEMMRSMRRKIGTYFSGLSELGFGDFGYGEDSIRGRYRPPEDCDVTEINDKIETLTG